MKRGRWGVNDMSDPRGPHLFNYSFITGMWAHGFYYFLGKNCHVSAPRQCHTEDLVKPDKRHFSQNRLPNRRGILFALILIVQVLVVLYLVLGFKHENRIRVKLRDLT